jgi:hypothetical protein
MKIFLVCLIVIKIESEGKTSVSGNAQFFPAWASPDPILCFCSLKDQLQYERNYGNYNEDYYEPFCDFHSETGYPLHAHYKKNQSKNKENYRKID